MPKATECVFTKRETSLARLLRIYGSKKVLRPTLISAVSCDDRRVPEAISDLFCRLSRCLYALSLCSMSVRRLQLVQTRF